MTLLSDPQIKRHLADLGVWEQRGDEIVKRFEFRTFVQAIAFVRRVADRAEAAGHQPDITIHYNKVTLALSTHSEGGITMKDIEAARSFDGAAG